MHTAATIAPEYTADECEILEQIADEHAADWETTVDGLASDEIPPPPATPWISLAAAYAEIAHVRLVTVDRYEVRATGSDVVTVRPVRRMAVAS